MREGFDLALVSLGFTSRMQWETQIARRLFPSDQTFMARRKLRNAFWTLVVALAASAMLVGIVLVAQSAR